MVGKPNFPVDVEQRTHIMGAAMATLGLDALDQEREASMADEGGVSGACMERQTSFSRPCGIPTRDIRPAKWTRGLLIGIGTVGLIGLGVTARHISLTKQMNSKNLFKSKSF